MVSLLPKLGIVLIVEDDVLLRMIAADIAKEAGFTVLEAANADEAIEILETRTDIAVLFTDIQMPGSMDGLRLAHAVSDRWPPIKIVVVSGNVEVDATDLPPNSRFFVKPFEVDKMVAELRSLVVR